MNLALVVVKEHVFDQVDARVLRRRGQAAPSGSGGKDGPPRPDLKGYKVDNNTYYDNGKPKPFIYGSCETAPET